MPQFRTEALNILKKYCLFAIASLVLMAGCDANPFGSNESSATVVINVNDETGTLSGDFIKSIYDPNNNQDFRYSVYDASRSVTFTNVEPGSYRAHATPVKSNNGNWVDITIKKGDHYTITFTKFINGYITVYGVTVPHSWWKNSVSKK